MRKRVLGMAVSCVLVCGLLGCVENSEMTTQNGTDNPGGQQPVDEPSNVCEGAGGLIDDLYQEDYPDTDVTGPMDSCPETHPYCITDAEHLGIVCSRCKENYVWDEDTSECQYDEDIIHEPPEPVQTPCGEGAYGCLVDNDKYCDGQCGADEYCLLSVDLTTGECSSCNFNCELLNPAYPVCVNLGNGIGGVCVAVASCPEGADFEFDTELGHYVCSGG